MKYLITMVLAILLVAPAWGKNAVNFRVELSGANEVPPVETDTSGSAILHVNRDLTEIRFKLDVRDGNKTLGAAGAHLHCAPADENGPVVVFLAGMLPPGYDGDFEIRATLTDDSIINDICGENITELVESMLDGNVYINVHDVDNPGGVIRGQVE